MAGVHEDFGEKIGGAKKDLWKDRGLYADDLEAMNEREAEKFVKKDNVWKKPDYAAMLEEGIPLGVVYFIKKARDGLNASPQYYRTDDTPEKRTARQKEYIKTVRELQTVLSDVRTVEDAVRAYVCRADGVGVWTLCVHSEAASRRSGGKRRTNRCHFGGVASSTNGQQ